jgi:hypothetical protein
MDVSSKIVENLSEGSDEKSFLIEEEDQLSDEASPLSQMIAKLN